jgi:hypothetical protein
MTHNESDNRQGPCRRNAIVLVIALIGAVGVFVLLISFVYAYLVYAAPLDFTHSAQLLLVAVPKLGFETFGERFSHELLLLVVVAVGLAALFPNFVRGHFIGFGTTLVLATSTFWVQTLVGMSSVLFLQFSSRDDLGSRVLERAFAHMSHPMISWTFVPALFALFGMLAAKSVQRHLGTRRS